MSHTVATFTFIICTLIISASLANASPTVIYPSEVSSAFHAAASDKIEMPDDTGKVLNTRHEESSKTTIEPQPEESTIAVTEALTGKNEINEFLNTPVTTGNDANAMNITSELNDEVSLSNEERSSLPATTQADGLIVDSQASDVTTIQPVESTSEKVTEVSSSSPPPPPLTLNHTEKPLENVASAPEESLAREETDDTVVVSKSSILSPKTDGKIVNLTSTSLDAPAAENEISFTPTFSATSMTSSPSQPLSTSNASSESNRDTVDDNFTGSTLTTGKGDTGVSNISTLPSPSPSPVEETSASSVSEMKEENTSTLATAFTVNQTPREGRTDDSQSESINYDKSLETTLPATPSSSPSTPSLTMEHENNITLMSSNATSSTIFSTTVQPLFNETQEERAGDSHLSSIADQSKSPPSELMTTPAHSDSTPHSLSTAGTPSATTTPTVAVSLTTAIFNSSYSGEGETSSSSPASSTSDTNVTGNITETDHTHTNTSEASVTTDIHLTSNVTDALGSTVSHSLGGEDASNTNSLENSTLTRVTSDDPLTGNDYSFTSTSESRETTAVYDDTLNALASSEGYPGSSINDVTGGNSILDSVNDTNETPKPLKTLETTPRASNDRSSRREAGSLLSLCMNSVEIIVVSIAVVFFTASALVICLLVGFCRRKGNTFDVQDPRNPLPPSFPRSLMSKPAHHNCKVTGPAIFGSHPLNRLQGYDLNNPCDILKDEESGHYTSRSRSSPSGYSVNNNNNNNNNNSKEGDGEKDSISLQPLHFCGPVDYIKKSSTLEYPVSLNGFSFKNHQQHHHQAPQVQPYHAGYHSSSGYKSLPGAGRILVNDAWMVLPQITCASNDHRRTSLSSRTSCNSSYEHPSRRHSCPPRQPFIHLAPGVTNVPPYIYHGPEHAFPFGLPPNCLKCATLTRDGHVNTAENVGFFPVTSDEIEYRPTSSKKHQATSPRRGSSASPQSAAESADSNTSHSGTSHHQQVAKSAANLSTKSNNPLKINSSSRDTSPTKACSSASSSIDKGRNGKNKSSTAATTSPYLKDNFYSTDPEVTDTKL